MAEDECGATKMYAISDADNAVHQVRWIW